MALRAVQNDQAGPELPNTGFKSEESHPEVHDAATFSDERRPTVHHVDPVSEETHEVCCSLHKLDVWLN